jgi:hypothetical protein
MGTGSLHDLQVMMRLLLVGALCVAAKTVYGWLRQRSAARRHRNAAAVSGEPPVGTAEIPAMQAALNQGEREFSCQELFCVTSPEAVGALLHDIFAGAASALVIFRHGTFLLTDAALDDAAEQARATIAEDGPVVAGGPHGDFRTHQLTSGRGYLVTAHNGRMFTYIAPRQLSSADPNLLSVGLFGRNKRHQDSQELAIMRVVPLQ